MLYQKGEIVVRRDIVFKDNGQRDASIGGHPAVYLHDTLSCDNHVFGVTATSNLHQYPKFPYKYYQLTLSNTVKLRKPSLANLSNVYKFENMAIPSVAWVKEQGMSELLHKLQEYHNSLPTKDADYSEFIERYPT